MYLHSFNYFRGIAIVIIVAGHCLYMSGWDVDRSVEKWLANLVLGGTTLFVFISGFLFHHIYSARFNYRKFMSTKIKNVLTPYLLISLPYVLYTVLVKGTGPYAEHIFSPEPGLYGSYVRPIALYLWTGRMLEAYWYIPFIMVVFALSPLIMAFIRLRPSMRLLILALLLTLSLFIQRPVLNLSVVQSVVYFLPVYLFGIVVSIHRQTIYDRLAGREAYLLAAAALLALVQAYWYPSFGNLNKPPFQPALPDVLLVQKLLLCVLFTIWLQRFEHRTLPILERLAAGSFAIYFIHPCVLKGVQLIIDRQYPVVRSWDPRSGSS